MNLLKRKSDEDLVAALQEGDIRSFDELYRRYSAKLFYLSYKRLNCTEVCEEIVQDFFVSLWERRAILTITVSFSAYVAGCARLKVFSYYHKMGIRNNHMEVVYNAFSESENAFIENIIDTKQLRDVIEQEVCRLPDKCRKIYELSRKSHLNNKEIAVQLGISEKTVENHMTKALKNIRLSIVQYL